MTVLLLRSVQTAGEIKQRTERMHPFETVQQVEEVLQGFMEYAAGPLVQEIEAGGGRRVKTYAHLLGGENAGNPTIIPQPQSQVIDNPTEKNAMEERLGKLEESLATVLSEISRIKEELGVDQS